VSLCTGSALSNASALWSLIAVLISVILRRTYPGGVLARDYDVSGGKKQDKAQKDKYRVHPSAEEKKSSSMVYPICEVDGDDGDGDLEGGPSGERRMKAGGSPPEGCEMVDRDGKAMPPPSSGQTAQGSKASRASAGSQEAAGAGEGGSIIRSQKDKDKHDGYFAMCLDECTAC
jgi:hypothetical protein